MTISEEISKLADLKEKGFLSPKEFEQAKKKILAGDPAPPPNQPTSHSHQYQFEDRSDDSFGKAANRYVSFQIIMSVIGVILFLLFVGPMMCSSRSPFSSGPTMTFPR